MSGNLWERSVTIGDDIPSGSDAGRVFTGTHGDGVLAANGDADAVLWPGTSAIGAGFRGGSWFIVSSALRVSARDSATDSFAGRSHIVGFRAVRLAP